MGGCLLWVGGATLLPSLGLTDSVMAEGVCVRDGRIDVVRTGLQRLQAFGESCAYRRGILIVEVAEVKVSCCTTGHCAMISTLKSKT